MKTADLSADPEALTLALQATGVGLWVFDLRTRVVRWNAAMHRVTGCSVPLEPARYLEFIHPDDRAVADSQMTKSLETNEI